MVRSNSNSWTKNQRKPTELEQHLLEKRLDLQKYFVFNLGKEIQAGNNFADIDGQKINNPFVRKINPALTTDLAKILGKTKSLLCFAGSDKDKPDLEWASNKLDEKIKTGSETYIVFDKTKINRADCAYLRKEIRYPHGFTLAVLAQPAVQVFTSKNAALDFLQKNDPLFNKNPANSPGTFSFSKYQENIGETKNNEKLFYYTFMLDIWEGGNWGEPRSEKKET